MLLRGAKDKERAMAEALNNSIALNPRSTGARDDKSFAAGAGDLLKVALSIEARVSMSLARPLSQLLA
jgi:hypothetical protein